MRTLLVAVIGKRLQTADDEAAEQHLHQASLGAAAARAPANEFASWSRRAQGASEAAVGAVPRSSLGNQPVAVCRPHILCTAAPFTVVTLLRGGCLPKA
jgi:hypothetical protein